jgi:hypothetical protein
MSEMCEVDKIMAYEQGEMNEEEMLQFFAEITKSGLVWNLQGHYGRTASRLIEAGYLDREGNILKDLED